MELKRISLIGIVFAFAISFAFPCATFACYTDAGYVVDCCFVNPSEKGDYCCATVEDCCAEGYENCEYNTWRDECDCGSSCDDSVVTSSCPSSSSSSTTTSCPATHRECGDYCCASDEDCCFNAFCTPEEYLCCPFAVTYGENSKEVELLRKYRDEVLNTTLVGRELIRLYYMWTPVIVKAMEQDEEFKEGLKEVIDEMLLMIGGEQ